MKQNLKKLTLAGSALVAAALFSFGRAACRYPSKKPKHESADR